MKYLSHISIILLLLSSNLPASATGIDNSLVLSLAVIPAAPIPVILAGTDEDGIYRSVDNGILWNKVSEAWTVSDLVVVGSTIYADTWDGTYKSTDQGATWAELAISWPGGIQAFVFADNILYAGTYSGYVWRLDDTTSTKINATPLGQITDLTWYKNALYASTETSIQKSSDGGTTWTAIDNGLDCERYESLAVYQNALWLLARKNYYYSAVWKTTDGENWELRRRGLTGGDPQALHAGENHLYASTDAGLFYSTDGNRWRSLYRTPNTKPIRLAEVPGDVPIIIASLYGDETGILRVPMNNLLPEHIAPSSPPKAVVILGGGVSSDNAIFYADQLESEGWSVTLVAPPDNTKDAALAALQGASLVYYDGHGFGYDPDDANYFDTGGASNGLAMEDGLITQDELIAHVQLADNALFTTPGACYTAGASATDSAVIESVAHRRVNDYSVGFLSIGASAYFAMFNPLKWSPSLYDGYIVEEIWQARRGTEPEYRYQHAQLTDMQIRLGYYTDNWENLHWGPVMIGDSNLTLSAVRGQHLVPSMSEVMFDLSINNPAVSGTVTINFSGSPTATWQVSETASSWLSISPVSGTVASSLNIEANRSGLAPGTYTKSVLLRDDRDAIHAIVVELNVKWHIYLSIARR